MTEREDRQPVMFGEPTPPGRKAGDCYLCQGDPVACDCQLEWTGAEGSTAAFTVGTDEEGAYLACKVDGEIASEKSRFRRIELVVGRSCPWCGAAPRRKHRDYCPCSAENRRAVKRAYAISDEMGRKVADSIRVNAQREANRG